MHSKRFGRGAARKHRSSLRHSVERLESRIVMDVSMDGLDSVVNDIIVGNQSTADQATALYANGSGIIAFAGRGVDDRQDVFVRQIDEKGLPVGDATRVNESPHGLQGKAAAAILKDGTTLVAWSGRGEGDQFGVFARRLDSSGRLLGKEIKINSTTFGVQTHPSIASLEDGGFVVAWSGTGRNDLAGVFLRQFDKAGNPIGRPSRVNSQRFGIQSDPVVVSTADGGFAVAWQGRGSDDHSGIFLRRFDADSSPSSVTRVNQTRRGVQAFPDIAALPDGELLITWSGRGDGDASGVYARLIDANGSGSGDEIRVNLDTSGFQYRPSAATSRDGSFLILWNEFSGRHRRTTVKGQHFTSFSASDSDPFVLPITETGRHYSPSVDSDHHGGYVVSWTTRIDHQEDVLARRFDFLNDVDADPPILSLNLTNDTGLSDHDLVTSDLATSGTITDASAIATVQLTVNEDPATTSDITRFLDADRGAFEFDDASLRGLLTQPIADGAVSISIVATDVAGNQSAPSELFVTLDTVAPDPPSVSAVTEDTGLSDMDGLTKDDTLVVSGTSSVGTSVTLRELTLGSLGTTVTDQEGRWRFALKGPLPPGSYSFTATGHDVAGNMSVESSPLSVTIDTSAPSVPAIDGIRDTGGNDVLNGATIDTFLSVHGSSDPLSQIELRDAGDSLIATTMADSNGRWTVDVETAASATLNLAIRVGAVDLAGNASPFSAAANVTVGVVPPAVPAIVMISDDTGAKDDDFITADDTLLITGTGRTGDGITLRDQSLRHLGQTTVGSTGIWTIDLAGQPLQEGDHSLTATATDSLGNTSEPSAIRQVRIDITSPPITNLRLSAESDTGVLGDQRTDKTTVDVVGVSEPGATVYWKGGRQEHSAVVGDDGLFRVNSSSLLPGETAYEFRVEDAAGNNASEFLTLFFEASLTVAESTFDSRNQIVLPIPIDAKTPSLRFDLETTFDRTSSGFASEDVFGISLLDPNDPSRALLKRSDGNRSLLTIAGDQAEYEPGLIRFDGTTVEVDLSSLAGRTEIALVAQWINSDDDLGSSARLSQIAIDEEPDAPTKPRLDLESFSVPAGDLVNLSNYAVEPKMTGVVTDVRFDPNTDIYHAKLHVQTSDVTSGRRVVVSLPGLDPDIEVLSVSGFDSSGAPYINVAPAILSGGLEEFSRSSSIDLKISNPSRKPLGLQPLLYSAGPNTAPVINDPGPLSVTAGGYLKADFSATDPDGDLVRYSIRSATGLPIARLTSDGLLTVTPAPGQEGAFAFEIVASDGFAKTSLPVSLTIGNDELTTTRISGIVLNTLSEPLGGIPIEFGRDATTTNADGRFELQVTAGSTADALYIRGEAFSGNDVYPFIAEKIPLLLGRDLYAGSQNVIGRPIYLPALDIANGQTITPGADTVVTTEAIPGAAVFVRAGSLNDQNGQPFTGVLSITEVPAELTPAALPDGLFTDLVVTIQPGEMVFETPAPLTLPNRAGHAPGTEMILWSISPITGEFERVGTGQVSGDGALIQTITGGIRNSSWHDFSTTEPAGTPPEESDNNPDKDCDDCDNRHEPQDSAGNFNPVNMLTGNRDAGFGDSSSPGASRQSTTRADRTESFTLSPGGSNGFASWSGGGAASIDGTVRDDLFAVATSSGDYIENSLYSSSTANGDVVLDSLFPPGRPAGGASEPETPLSRNHDPPASSVSTHAGALHKSHHVAAYNSLGTGRGLTLVYDSERADPRPIVHAEVQDPGRNIDSPLLVSGLTVFGGSATFPLRQDATSGTTASLALPAIQTADQFRTIESGLDAAGTVHQISELAEYPSGRYGYTSSMRISGAGSLATAGLTTSLNSKLVHINSVDGPFGSGWGIAGHQHLIVNYDGSVLLVDGDGGESVFEALDGSDYFTAPGDFSRLYPDPDGTFRRVLIDQTVYHYRTDLQLGSIVDRNGNTTDFGYESDGRLVRITDPVGLHTHLEYSQSRVTAIVDPANRRTEIGYDDAGNLVSITDPDATSRKFDYDRQHRLTAETNKNGDTEQIEYDWAGRIQQFTRADGSVIRYAPAQSRAFVPPELTSDPTTAPPAVSLGRQAITSVADANGNVTRTRLDRAGQTVTAADGAGTLPSFVRSPDNRVTEFTDGRGNVTFMTYDDRGNVTSIADPIARGVTHTSLFNDRVYLTGTDPRQIISADVNGDELLDAVVATEGSDALFVHIGRGDGTFDPPRRVPLSSARSIVAADFDSDGLQDVAAARAGGVVSIVFGLGEGQFSAPINVATGIETSLIKTTDLDRDGNTDLVLLSPASENLYLLRGTETRSFLTPQSRAISPDAVDFSIADLNSDGNVDVVVANRTTSENISVLLATDHGSLGTRTDSTLTASELLAVRLADFDHDGIIDLIASDGKSAVWFAGGGGDGEFGSASEHRFIFPFAGTPTQTPTTILNQADLNSDGNLDLVVGQPTSGAFNTLFGDGDGNFGTAEVIFVGEQLVSLAIADLNNDDVVDVISTSHKGQFVAVHLGSAEGVFGIDLEATGVGVIFDAPPDGINAVDVDGDGLTDLVAYSALNDSVSILRNDGLGSLESPSTLSLDSAPSNLSLRDIDSDDNVDFLIPQPADDRITLVFGDGTTSGDGATISLDTIDQPNKIEAADVNGDGTTDLIVLGSSQLGVLLGAENREFASAPPIDLGNATSQIVTADFNRDGAIDIALGSSSSTGTKVTIRLGSGDGIFGPAVDYPLAASDSTPLPLSGLRSIDVDDDGDMDLIASDPTSDSIRVLLGDGDGTFATAMTTIVGGNPVDFTLTDVTGDGIEDLIVAAARDGMANVLTGVGDGTFIDRQDYYLGANPVGIAVIDVLGDNSYNLYSVNAGSEFLVTVLGTAGRTDAVNAKQIEYDPVFSQMTRLVDELGNETLVSIDAANGNVLSMSRVIGEVGGGDDLVTSFTYTSRGQVDTMTDPLGRVTDYEYDSFGRLIATTFAVGTADQATRSMEYDAAGNVTAMIDELGHRTEYTFDALNRLVLTTETDPDGPGPLSSQTRSYAYDDHGNLANVADGLTAVLAYQHDQQHRLVAKTDSDGNSWNYRYDNAGNLREMTDRLGRATTYRYDDRHRLASVVDPERGLQRYLYDADDNAVRRFDENGSVWITDYDARNRTTRQVDPLGHETRAIYDRVNNVVTTLDSLSRRTEFEYDDAYRLVSLVEPDPDGPSGPLDSPTYNFEYDKAGNQTRRIDPLRNAVAIEYDDRDRPTIERLPDPDDDGPLAAPIFDFTYDDANRLTEVLDPIGRVTSYRYDDLNRLIRTEFPDPDGDGPDGIPVTTNAYDLAGNLIRTVDPLGNATTFEYDTLYRLVKRTDPDPDGNGPLVAPTTSLTFDRESQLKSMTDPLGRSVEYAYDLLGRTVMESYPDPDGTGPDLAPRIMHTYDPAGNRIATTDPLGNTTRFEFDDDHRLVHVIAPDPDGADGPASEPITRFVRDAADQLLQTIDPLCRVMSYQYDDLGRSIRETYADPDGDGPLAAPIMTYRFDAIGNVLSMTDALGNATDYVYDNLYRRSDVILADPDGPGGPQIRPQTHLDYDIVNRPIAVTDPLGRRTEFLYDNLDRVIRETAPDPDGPGPLAAPQSTYTFDLVGNQLSMTDAIGGMTRFTYDNLYRGTTVIQADPDGTGPLTSPEIRYTYDVASQLLTATDPLGRTVANTYDNLGRVVRVTEPDPDADGPFSAPVTSYRFDLVGNELAMTDPLGHVTRYAYDNLYRRTQQISEDLDGDEGSLGNPVTVYRYDLVGNLLSLTDPVGNTTRWQYDDLDRGTSETITVDGMDVSRLYQYDVMNNLTRQTDRNGRVIEFEYDDLHRLVSERWLDENDVAILAIDMLFDEANQLLTSHDVTAGSRYDYQYDDLGRVTASFVANGGSTIRFDSVYDAQSRRTSHKATVGSVADYENDYEFDALHRLTVLRQTGQPSENEVAPKRFDFGYNDASQIVSIERFSEISGSTLIMSSQYRYDGQARLARLEHNDDASTVARYDFAYDAASRMTEITSLVDGKSDYGYDNGDQLTDAVHTGQPNESYRYDENGNRTNTNYQTADHNRLRSDGQFTYEHDAEGNRVLRTDLVTGSVTEYAWDHRNRLTAVTDRESSHGPIVQTVEHRYDPFDRWISTTVDSDGEGGQLPVTTRYEYDGDNIVLRRDAEGNVTGRYTWGVLVDQIMAEENAETGEVLYPLSDHVGSVRDISDANGNVVNHVRYDSYGNIENETDETTETLFGYTGKPLDEATGLQNNHHRWYDAAVGRWTTEDPIGFSAGDTNLNRYAGNRPTTATDPTGQVIFFVHGIANRNREEMEVLAPIFAGEGGARQEVVHFIYGRGRDEASEYDYPNEPTALDAFTHTNSRLNQAAGRELATLIKITQSNMNRQGVNEPIHVIGYSNGSNVVYEMTKHITHSVDSILLLGGSIKTDRDLRKPASRADRMFIFTSKGDGATKLVDGIGSQGVDDRYLDVPNLIVSTVPNVFHSLGEAYSSHPLLTAESDSRVTGKVTWGTTGFKYDLIGFDDSFTYNANGTTDATAWLTRFMAETYYAPLLGLGFGEDNLFSANAVLPNGIPYDKCDDTAIEYVFYFYGN